MDDDAGPLAAAVDAAAEDADVDCVFFDAGAEGAGPRRTCAS